MTVRRSLAILTILLTVTGCGDTTPGTPTPAPTTSTSTNRPKELNLTGKESCLIPQTSWATYFIEKNGKITEEKDRDPKGVQCMYSTNVGYFGFLLNTTDGIKYWTETSSSEKVDSVTPIQGYPTVERADSLDKNACEMIIDVADGQALVAFASIDAPSQSKLPPKCEVARQLADIAITALNR